MNKIKEFDDFFRFPTYFGISILDVRSIPYT